MSALFAITLFVSATLLFLVQPMIGKMLLPKFGGAPNVWNTCMVFFQVALLGGYAYAHVSTTWLGVRRQAVLHLVLMLLPFLFLPILVEKDWHAPPEDSPIGWLLYLLMMTAGVPFFVIASSAPLLQRWFASTGEASAQDPYYLYAASNLGSMMALLGYPLLVEPVFRLNTQSEIWRVGYVLLVVLTFVCAMAVWRAPAHQPSRAKAKPPQTGAGAVAMTPWTRLYWVALAFVPSSLMLGATTYMSTDLSPIPLLWVIPLALYLLSFILVFSRLPAWGQNSANICGARA